MRVRVSAVVAPVLLRLTRLSAACLPLLLAACGVAPGGVHVTIDSPLSPGRDFDHLSVTAFLADGKVPLKTERFEGDDLTLPKTVNFVSGKATAAGTRVVVEATAELNGQIVSFAKGEAVLEARDGAQLALTLPAAVLPADGGRPQELCDNGVDDNGDGRADCADDQCDGKSCLAGGLQCMSKRCTCASGTAGGLSTRSGFQNRSNPTAVRIAVGPFADHLAIVGGKLSDGGVTTTVELVGLTSTSFSTTALNSPRERFNLVALADGGLLVAGGDVSSFEVFRAADGGFAATTVTPTLRAASSAVLLAEDALYFAGGELLGTAPTANVVKLLLRTTPDGGVGAQRVVGQLSEARKGTGAVLSSGELLMVGGAGTTSTRTDLLAADGTLRSGPTMPERISDAAVIALKDGQVLIIGGQVGSGNASAKAFLATAIGSAVGIRELSPMTTPRTNPRAVLLENGWVYVDDPSTGNGEWFDPASQTFISATPSGRAGHAIASAGQNGVALAGGGAGGAPDGKLMTLSLQCP